MNTIKFYKELPETLPKEEIYNYFNSTILDFDCKNIEIDEFLAVLTELMERQAYVYEQLPEQIKTAIDIRICKIWNTENSNQVDIMLTLIVSLGLEQSYEKVKQSLDEKNITSDILKEIEETVKDAGDNVSNPYKDWEI